MKLFKAHRLKSIGLILLGLATLFSNYSPVLAIPMPDRDGDYTAPKRVLLYPTWQVVDPDPNGLNCRTPQRFQGKTLGDYADQNNDRYRSIADELLQSGIHDIEQWEVLTRIYQGDRFNAYGGNLGAQIIVKDRQNKTWMPISVSANNQLMHCFVRANKRFIQPI